jgi:hypothetical protein
MQLIICFIQLDEFIGVSVKGGISIFFEFGKVSQICNCVF